jgi:mitogen-activated protein kinase kinase 1
MRPLPPPQGLLYLHGELHVVHRDLKPSNLLLNSEGRLKISDFGVSGHLADSVSKCVSWVGTVTYMSPERIKGEAYSYDADVWALGLCAMECALGRFPYGAPDGGGLGFWELLDFIVSEPAPALPAESFSPELRAFAAACLEKEPRARPSLAALAAHPFLAKYPPADLAALIPPALQQQSARDGS